MSDQTFGYALGGLGLTGFAAALVAIKTGALDTLMAAALPVLSVGAVAVVVGALATLGGIRGGAHGRSACGYTSSIERDMHRHEQGHVNACTRAGGGRSTYEVWQNPDGSWSGLTTHHDGRRLDRLTPERQIAILAAGITAAPRTGSPTDEPRIRALVASLPAEQRAGVERKGRALARRWAR